jgi:hypothetical protein
MPNSYSTIPNILPGDVSIGGNLIVNGNLLRLGSAPGFLRLQWKPAEADFTWNFEEGTGNRDTNSDGMCALHLTASGSGPFWERGNINGNIRFEALPTVIYTRYSNIPHTGTTTEDTIDTATIRPIFMGPDGGLHLRFHVNHSTQGGTVTTVRVKFGGTLMGSYTVAAPQLIRCEVTIYNRSSQSAQIVTFDRWSSVLAPSPSELQTSVITANVNDITVTVQNGVVGDVQSWRSCIVSQENSFGPVTT